MKVLIRIVASINTSQQGLREFPLHMRYVPCHLVQINHAQELRQKYFQRAKIKQKIGNFENVTELWLSSALKSISKTKAGIPSNSYFGYKG